MFLFGTKNLFLPTEFSLNLGCDQAYTCVYCTKHLKMYSKSKEKFENTRISVVSDMNS